MSFQIANVVAGFGSFDAATVTPVTTPGILFRRTPGGAAAGDFEVLVEGADFWSTRTVWVANLDNPGTGGFSINVTPAGALVPDTLRVLVFDAAGVASDTNFSLLALNRQ